MLIFVCSRKGVEHNSTGVFRRTYKSSLDRLLTRTTFHLHRIPGTKTYDPYFDVSSSAALKQNYECSMRSAPDAARP